MINAARERLVRTLRNDGDLFSIVSGRVYPADLATLLNPKYPCITTTFSGGAATPYGYNPDLADASVVIQYYSTKSYKDVWDMYEKAKAVLAFGVFKDDEVTLRMLEEGIPFERWDAESRIYVLTNNWNVLMIGA
jgi:hypothetical protein